MPPKPKRHRVSPDRSISPPEVKRRAIEIQTTISSVLTPNSTCIRIFSWNVNGVDALVQKRLSFNTVPESPLRTFLKRHEWPQCLCIQEVKINSKDEVTQRRLQHAANAGSELNEPIYVVHFSLPRDKFNATGFGGKVHGVATLIREDFSYYVKATTAPQWDLEGRVLIHELVNKVVVINGYWVNGTTNPYRNPETGVIEGTRHDHKLRFHQHMLDEALRYRRNGCHVVLVGDMNVARHELDGHPNLRTSPVQHVKNRFDFNKKFFLDEKGLQAVDVFRQFHGGEKKYTYHPRGATWGRSCDRVDLIVVTEGLLQLGAVKATDICDNPGDRGHSDHVPLWIELDFARLHPKSYLVRDGREQTPVQTEFPS